MSDVSQQQGWAPRDPSAPAPTISRFPAPRKKSREKDRPRRTGLRRLLPTRRTLLGTLLFGTLLLGGGLIAGYHLVGIPAANTAATLQSNLYLYADGTQIARDGEINRENIRLAQVPRAVQRAVLAAEDRGFYSDPAVNPQGMVRAVWNTVTGKGTQGGSTITQQYVKNYYLGQEQTVVRKAKELFIAIKLNREETKKNILQGYLNTSYFGRNAYGIQAAAQAYYGKEIEDVNLAEGAYLASLLNAPSDFDVVVHPENRPAAEARWNYVLDGMVKERWLTPAVRATLAFPVPNEVRTSNSGLSGQRGYVVQAVEDYLVSNKIIDEHTLAAGGHRITTTLEREKQDAFGEAVQDIVLSRLDTGRAADRNVRVGGVSIDPATGKVVAMYGGIDYTKQYVNNATRRDYQVGSTFKPFVLAAAVENNSRTRYGEPITPNTVYDGNNQRMVEGVDGPTGYAPANEDHINYGPLSLREATDKSVNAVYAQLAQDIGPATVRNTAIALGLPSNTPDLRASPSIALGPASASVLDMAKAYATLANHGRHGTYTLVQKISRNGTKIDLPHQEPRQVISREAADTTTAVLRGVVEGGTGTAALSAGRPAAGKTGTAEDDKAAWFAGYTPDLATVVAMMGADPKTAAQRPLYGALGQDRINGGGPPAEIWGRFTANALRDTQSEDFDLRLDDGAEEVFSPEDGSDPFGEFGGGAPGDTGDQPEGGGSGSGDGDGEQGQEPESPGQSEDWSVARPGVPAHGPTGGNGGGAPVPGGHQGSQARPDRTGRTPGQGQFQGQAQAAQGQSSQQHGVSGGSVPGGIGSSDGTADIGTTEGVIGRGARGRRAGGGGAGGGGTGGEGAGGGRAGRGGARRGGARRGGVPREEANGSGRQTGDSPVHGRLAALGG
ncbi:transglycosylase domain-containing protein [Streptomyces sp. NPDC088341]|uniref:transglycosylase domain-containing protein n=1 Tax=Streptomyces sp. NPDC088341 TaxID=3154870 RepID=UPI003420AF53